MPPYAGFGAVLTLRQSALQGMIQVLYNAGKIQHAIQGSAAAVSLDLFLDVPRIQFLSNAPNSLFLNLRAWGPLTVKVANAPTETRKVILTIRERIPYRVSLQNKNLVFSLDAFESYMEGLTFEVYSGGPFSPQAQAVLDSDSTGFYLQLAISSLLAELQGDMLPSLNMDLFGPLISGTNTRATARSLQHCMAIGFDMEIDVNGGLITNGDPAQMVDTAGGLDAGCWLNPALLGPMITDARKMVEEEVKKEGATLDNLNVSLIEGSIHVEGKASKTGGSVTFSLDLVPRLVRPGKHVEWYDEEQHFSYTTPSRNELWFQTQNVHADVHKDWWVTLLEVFGGFLTFGIAALFVESFVNMIRNNIASGIESSGGRSVGNCVNDFTLPGVPGAKIRMAIGRFDCHADGIQFASSIQPQFASGARLCGPEYVPIEDVARASLKYEVTPPPNAVLDDPELKVRWTVRRVEGNRVLLQIDDSAASNSSVRLDVIRQELYNTSKFSVECRMYRALGAEITDFHNGRVSLRIYDRLDRSKPYVRWTHYVLEPVVRVEQDGSQTSLGYELQYRKSDIHRTAYPGRCLMASRYSAGMPFIGPKHKALVLGRLKPTGLTYMDDLPFPRADLMKHRHELCDYCFFGGPDKTRPIV